MKSAWVVAVVVCVVLSSAAFAQTFTPRSMGMGNAAVGVANDAGAWFQNPAGLGALSMVCQPGKEWANDAIGAFADTGDDDAWTLNWAGWQPAKAVGIGAGFADRQDFGNVWGAGFGIGLRNTPWSFGVNVATVNLDAVSEGDDDTTTTFDLGTLYQFAQPEKAPIRVGLVARDISDEIQTTFDLGVAWPATDKLLVAVDVIDISDELDTRFNAGVEFAFGTMNEWTARIGEFDDGADNNLTLGLGYGFTNKWRLDAAWQDSADNSLWSVGAGFGF